MEHHRLSMLKKNLAFLVILEVTISFLILSEFLSFLFILILGILIVKKNIQILSKINLMLL